MIKLRSTVSTDYKIILEPQKTFKQDGEITRGKRVYFRNGVAEVDEETFELIKKMPAFGVDFHLDTSEVKQIEPVQAKPKAFGRDNEVIEQNTKVENLSKQVGLLTEVVKSLAKTIQEDKQKELKKETKAAKTKK